MQQKIIKLRNYITNATKHWFSNHNKCEPYFRDLNKNDKNYTQQMRETCLLYNVMDVMNNMADLQKSILFNANNNTVEQFNSITENFVGRKQIKFSLRCSYQN